MSFDPTDEQLKAIQYEGNLVAIAKPGSGKTYVLSEKIRKSIQSLPDYRGVVALSYTNKASAELKSRSSKITANLKSSFFGTIDHFCLSEIILPFLKQLWGIPSQKVEVSKFSELEGDRRELLEELDQDENRQLNLAQIFSIESLLLEEFENGKVFIDTAGALAIYVLQKSLSCKNYIKSRYTHIFIDEFQDSGKEQYDLMLEFLEMGLICTAVGDDQQSIFEFSGKSSEHLLALAKDDRFRQFPILKNHRCHPSIINYSLTFFSDNPALIDCEELRVYEKNCSGTQKKIANWIDETIPRLMTDFEIINLSDIGILYRGGSTDTASVLSESLETDYRIYYSNPLEDSFSLWSKLFCQLFCYHFENGITAEEIIDLNVRVINQRDRKELRKQIKTFRDLPMESFRDEAEKLAELMYPDSNSEEALMLLDQCIEKEDFSNFQPVNKDEIQIMTLHKAKGLEFDIVFHLDLYEWTFPAKRPSKIGGFDNPEYPSKEQDVNLHYVAITRAKKACFLCTSTQRKVIDYQTKKPTIKTGNSSEFLRVKKLKGLRKNSPF